MKSSRSQWFAMAGLMAGLLSASSGAIAASTWAYSFNGPTDGSAATTWYTGAPTTAPDPAISGAYVANGTANAGTASATSKWTTGSESTLQFYSGGGLGMSSDGAGTPNHAIDNAGNTEAVLLSFSSSVALNTITLGYFNGDADISLFRYVGTSAPVLTSTVATLNGLGAMLAAGWELVGNYADLSTGSSAVNSSAKGSSWWLVSAYNTNFGTTVAADFNAATGNGLTQGDDYFKLASVAANTCTDNTAVGGCNNKVPEPASLALIALGLLGVAGVRRRNDAAKDMAA